MKPFIPKEHPDIPDSYGIKISYNTGKTREVQIVSHKLIELLKVPSPTGDLSEDKEGKFRYSLMPHPSPYFEFITKDDEVFSVPVMAIQELHFDKSWNKILEIRRKIQQNSQPENSSPDKMN